MICSVPIFFPEYVHQYIFNKAQKLSTKIFPSTLNNSVVENYQFPSFSIKPLAVLWSFHVVFQIIFPLRFVLYPGNLFWTEEGYRFGWRVMLMEKAGYTTFYIKDGEHGKEGLVINSDFLNSHQEKQMAMQPDMILEFAHFLGKYYKNQGMKNPIVRAEAFVTLNGSRSKLLVNPTVNLLAKQESLKPKDWLMPF
jgi:Vitamin K-dependent gamma-carboxylase